MYVIIAAILGAAITQVGNAIYRSRKKRRENREKLVNQMVAVSYRLLAAIIEYAVVFGEHKSAYHPAVLREFASVMRIDGDAVEYYDTLSTNFREDKVASSYHGFLVKARTSIELMIRRGFATHDEIASDLRVSIETLAIALTEIYAAVGRRRPDDVLIDPKLLRKRI